MKLHKAFIVAALSMSVFVGESSAQNSDGPSFGKGRLLKKVGDIFSNKPKLKFPSFKSSSTPSTSQGKFRPPATPNAPTPALPSAGQIPASIDSQANYRARRANLTNNPVTSGSSSTQYSTQYKSTHFKSPTAAPTAAPKTANSKITPQAIENVTRSAKKQSHAFGMLLQSRGKDLVVTQINPNGNASKAGVRKGDLILGGGGVEFGSMLNFNEITELLKDGDQIEFLVGQAGKENKILIPYGKIPGVSTTEIARATNRGSQTRTASNTTSSLNQYDLVTPNSTMRSVINSDESTPQTWKYNSGAQNTQQQIKAVESAAVRGKTILNVPK